MAKSCSLRQEKKLQTNQHINRKFHPSDSFDNNLKIVAASLEKNFDDKEQIQEIHMMNKAIIQCLEMYDLENAKLHLFNFEQRNHDEDHTNENSSWRDSVPE